jgi:aromatic-L-amino-acid decarboxylase
MGIAGLGRDNLRLVEVDDAFAMRPDALDRRIAEDRAAGRVPCFVCATVGTTSSNAIDPVEAIGRICRREGIWLHVDAAMSGTAALCPEFRHLQAGLDHADSYCFNPHKWMFTTFDASAFWVRDRGALIRTLSILPEYLRNQATESGAVIDYRDWQIPLGRRFRALKLWFVLRHFGAEGLRHRLRRHIDLARSCAEWVDDDTSFERLAPTRFSVVVFRVRPAGETDEERIDDLNTKVLQRLNDSGEVFLSHTRVGGRYALRLAVGNIRTTATHVARAWQLAREAAQSLT